MCGIAAVLLILLHILEGSRIPYLIFPLLVLAPLIFKLPCSGFLAALSGAPCYTLTPPPPPPSALLPLPCPYLSPFMYRICTVSYPDEIDAH